MIANGVILKGKQKGKHSLLDSGGAATPARPSTGAPVAFGCAPWHLDSGSSIYSGYAGLMG